MSGPMRIVVAGEMIEGSTAPALAQGFRTAGCAVQQIDQTRFVSTRSGWAGRLARIALGVAVHAYNRQLLKAAESSPRVMLIVKGSFVSPATLAQIRKMGTLTVLFYPDVEWKHPGLHPDLCDHFDLVFTTKSFHLPMLQQRLGADRVRFIHHGFDPLIHRRLALGTEADFVRDLVFIGNFSPYKMAMLLPLAERFDGSFAVMGGGWSSAVGSPIERFVTHAIPRGDEYVLELGRSRIAIGLHHGPVKTPGWEDLVSTRSFEIPAAGSMMVHVDNTEIRDLFDAGAEFVPFADPLALTDQITRYLAQTAERRAIAHAGHQRAMKDHSYWHRAHQMLAEFPSRIA